MTPLEARAIRALSNCGVQPFGGHAVIIHQWEKKLANNEPMTAKGIKYLWKLVYKYRRQIQDAELIEYAETQKE